MTVAAEELLAVAGFRTSQKLQAHESGHSLQGCTDETTGTSSPSEARSRSSSREVRVRAPFFL